MEYKEYWEELTRDSVTEKIRKYPKAAKKRRVITKWTNQMYKKSRSPQPIIKFFTGLNTIPNRNWYKL